MAQLRMLLPLLLCLLWRPGACAQGGNADAHSREGDRHFQRMAYAAAIGEYRLAADLGAVNQWLRGQSFVRPDRIAVTGGSYGGYMVLAAITLQPELWAAACDIVGIANFRTFLERTAPYRRALREAEYGSLARDGEVLDRVSPIHRVDRIRAPLFVIHGANDPRVPVQEAEQIVAALRARNQRVEYVRFENEGHGIFRRENKVRAYGQLVRFFNEVLGAP